MKWYTAIGCKGEDGEGRLLVKTDNQEKVLTEMETMLWQPLPGQYVQKTESTLRCTGYSVLHLGKNVQQSGRMKKISCFV